MFCSSLARKTSISLMMTYVVLLVLYAVPAAIVLFLTILEFPESRIAIAQWTGIASPFTATFSLPLNSDLASEGLDPVNPGNLRLVFTYFACNVILIASMVSIMQWRLSKRSEWGE